MLLIVILLKCYSGYRYIHHFYALNALLNLMEKELLYIPIKYDLRASSFHFEFLIKNEFFQRTQSR